MGIIIKTDDRPVNVWRSDNHGYPQYAIGISKKGDDGQWVREYQQVKFRKGIELANNESIFIHNAFPTLSIWRDKDGQIHKRQVWMILDFTYATQQPAPEPQPQPQQKATQMQMSAYAYDDIPDSFAAAEDEIPF